MGNRAGAKISVSLPRSHLAALDAHAAEAFEGNRSAALAAALERAFPALQGGTNSGAGLPREATVRS